MHEPKAFVSFLYSPQCVEIVVRYQLFANEDFFNIYILMKGNLF